MQANIITLARITLAFLAIALFGASFWGNLLATLLVAAVIWMDAWDGYVARKLGIASKLGALLDITGDRIVENAFWIYFAVVNMVPLWMPLAVISRSFIVDSLRAAAFAEGKTAFGPDTMMKSPLTKFLVASPFSRALYGFAKAAVFIWLGLILTFVAAAAEGLFLLPQWAFRSTVFIGDLLAYVTVILCLLRALPVIRDAWPLVVKKQYPRSDEI
ncbi:MAG: CDP-alcohol phosphatidyltransferase family protein [candidate division Zixibacteria bacterium]|nr:CDP-alcohol phosphatidyltransferase family protein [candidate division Zixibacteria bacterium]